MIFLKWGTKGLWRGDLFEPAVIKAAERRRGAETAGGRQTLVKSEL